MILRLKQIKKHSSYLFIMLLFWRLIESRKPWDCKCYVRPVAMVAKKSDLTFCWYTVCDASVISSLSETAKSSRISICVEGNRLMLVLVARSLKILMIYTFCKSHKALFQRSRITWSSKIYFSSPFLLIVSAFESEATVFSTLLRWSFLNANTILPI